MSKFTCIHMLLLLCVYSDCSDSNQSDITMSDWLESIAGCFPTIAGSYSLIFTKQLTSDMTVPPTIIYIPGIKLLNISPVVISFSKTIPSLSNKSDAQAATFPISTSISTNIHSIKITGSIFNIGILTRIRLLTILY